MYLVRSHFTMPWRSVADQLIVGEGGDIFTFNLN